MIRTKSDANFLEMLVRDEWMRSRQEGSSAVLKKCLERIARLDTEPDVYEKEVEAFIHEYETLGEQPLLFLNANGCLGSYPALSDPAEMIATAITQYQEFFDGEVPSKVTMAEEYQEVMQDMAPFVLHGKEIPVGYNTNYPPQTLMCWSPTSQKHE